MISNDDNRFIQIVAWGKFSDKLEEVAELQNVSINSHYITFLTYCIINNNQNKILFIVYR